MVSRVGTGRSVRLRCLYSVVWEGFHFSFVFGLGAIAVHGIQQRGELRRYISSQGEADWLNLSEEPSIVALHSS